MTTIQLGSAFQASRETSLEGATAFGIFTKVGVPVLLKPPVQEISSEAGLIDVTPTIIAERLAPEGTSRTPLFEGREDPYGKIPQGPGSIAPPTAGQWRPGLPPPPGYRVAEGRLVLVGGNGILTRLPLPEPILVGELPGRRARTDMEPFGRFRASDQVRLTLKGVPLAGDLVADLVRAGEEIMEGIRARLRV